MAGRNPRAVHTEPGAVRFGYPQISPRSQKKRIQTPHPGLAALASAPTVLAAVLYPVKPVNTTSINPTCVNIDKNTSGFRVPDTQSAQDSSPLQQAESPVDGARTMSAICRRPPGRSIRNTSPSTVFFSSARLIAPLEITTSAQASGRVCVANY